MAYPSEALFAYDTYFSSRDLMVNIVKTLLLLGSDLTIKDDEDSTIFTILKEMEKNEMQRRIRDPRIEENLKEIQKLLSAASSPTHTDPTHTELLGID
jgi:hypothetical protein